MHENELRVPDEVAWELVRHQFPEWRELAITPVDSEGTVNAIFRIGDSLAARFPLQPGDPDEVRQWLRAEADAARELADHVGVPVPEPVTSGEPGPGYPLPWSVYTWVPGITASHEDVSASRDFALDLAVLIGEIRAIDVGHRRFSGNGRGGDLRSHDGWMDVCFDKSGQLLDVPRLRRVWERLRQLPRESPDLMTHGDLIPGNVLVAEGRLAGLLDVGGLGPADPAVDLVAAWHLLDAGPRQTLREALGCDVLEWERGKAWAFQQAMGAVWYYIDTNPAMSRMGRTTLGRILADEPTH